MRKEGATPSSHAVAQPSADHLGRQPTRGAASRVDQSGLACQGLPILDHPDDIAGASADARAGNDDQVALMTEHFADLGAQAPSDRARIELRLNDDSPAVDMQPAGESQDRRNFRLPVAGLGDLDGRQLCLHLSGHCHPDMMACNRHSGLTSQQTNMTTVASNTHDFRVCRGEP